MVFLSLSAALASRLRDASVDIEYRGRDRAGDHAPTWFTLAGLVSKSLPTPLSKGALARAAPRRGRDIAKKHI